MKRWCTVKFCEREQLRDGGCRFWSGYECVSFLCPIFRREGMTSSCREFLLEVDQGEGLLLIALSLLWVRFDHRLFHAVAIKER